MSLCKLRRCLVAVALGITLPLIILPDAGEAQIGAIGGSFAGGGTGDDMYNRGPILTESGYLLEKGQFTVGAYYTYGSYTYNEAFWFQLELDTYTDFVWVERELTITSSQIWLSGYYGLTEKLMAGFSVMPSISFDTEDVFSFSQGLAEYQDVTFEGSSSGMGDLSLYSKYQVWKHPLGRARLAVLGSVRLPTGDDDMGMEGTTWSAAIAGSARKNRFNFHSDLGFQIPTEKDYKSSFSFNASAVYALGSKVGLSGELIGSASDGETMLETALGFRGQLSTRMFLSGAFVYGLDGPDYSIFDHQFILGLDLLF